MPVAYTVLDGGSFVEFVGSGVVGGRELVACKLAMAGDRSIAQGFAELCDLTAVSGTDQERGFFERIVEATRACHEAHAIGRMAVVVSRPEFFDLAREYERLVAGLGITVIVFNHRDTAMLWLGRTRRDAGGVRVRPSAHQREPGQWRWAWCEADWARRDPPRLS